MDYVHVGMIDTLMYDQNIGLHFIYTVHYTLCVCMSEVYENAFYKITLALSIGHGA